MKTHPCKPDIFATTYEPVEEAMKQPTVPEDWIAFRDEVYDELKAIIAANHIFAHKMRELGEENARLERELAEAKAGWDSCIADLREAAEICKGVERQRDEARALVAAFRGENYPNVQQVPFEKKLGGPERPFTVLKAARSKGRK